MPQGKASLLDNDSLSDGKYDQVVGAGRVEKKDNAL